MVRGTGSGTGSPKYRNFGVSSPADEEKIRKLILEVKPSRNVRNTGMTNELINLLYDKKKLEKNLSDGTTDERRKKAVVIYYYYYYYYYRRKCPCLDPNKNARTS